MAFPPISFASSSASSACSCSSSLHFLHFQPQFCPSSSSVTFRFRVSCSNQTAHFDTEQPRRVKVTSEGAEKKKKNSARPSFFDQIRDKWTLKLSSPREKFPWEEPEQQEDEEEDGGGKPDRESSGTYVSESMVEVKASVIHPVSSQSRNHFSPWHQAVQPLDRQVDSEPDIADNDGKLLENNVTGSFTGKNEILGEKRNDGEVDSELYNGHGSPVVAKATRETIRSMEGKRIFSKDRSNSHERDHSDIRWLNEENRDSGNLPSQRVNGEEGRERDRKRRSNTELADKLVPEHELRRLRNIALRMVERIDVGVAGITQELVDSIHAKWMEDEVVKLKFEGPLAANMRRAHEILERKTGGLVVWRSGSSIVLYRQSNYNLPCVRKLAKLNQDNVTTVHHSEDVENHTQVRVNEPVRTKDPAMPDSTNYLKNLSEEEYMELIDLNDLLDELGPRFKDWAGREPLPVDADLLPGVVPGYKTPYRLLPHGIRPGLRDKEMTNFRRLARTMAPHFALGRNRELQGLAKAMVKLWERSAIAKIAIKRGVLNTMNERMAEQLKKLTGGTLLSRNKDYIVFYRGNDFLPPAVTEALTERHKLALLKQDEEDQVRQIASSLTRSTGKASQIPFVAGTLAETKAATTQWGHQPSSQEVEKMRRDSAISKLTSIVKNLEKKLAHAKARVKKAERTLAKMQDGFEPADLPNDLETLTSEERFLFRKIGLSMKPFLLLGEVFILVP
ncbi:CRM-domain containing factor CFM3, chloroplastic/mitochondrial isoform X2 [Neltuma alba]|uniref:CRM-domain containing factor CFM3, chloroplastic/mitochondrial isoform X2 n=1 Tax=Neltuma alba TaxID=207710 RepID=UPI0010A3904F|nr:CRM-domain containing factor CFM3, chloroplastic/mitochondrial isoform X2 [Prosopis alba]